MSDILDQKTTIEVMFRSCIGGKQEIVVLSVNPHVWGELTMCTEIKEMLFYLREPCVVGNEILLNVLWKMLRTFKITTINGCGY